MKARQDIETYVNKENVPVSHYSGDSMDGKRLIKVKKGEEVPKELLSYFIQSNREYLELDTETEIPKSKPFITPRKHSQESLTKLINSFGQKKTDALEALKKILLDDFGTRTRSNSIGYVRNKVLTIQETKRRG